MTTPSSYPPTAMSAFLDFWYRALSLPSTRGTTLTMSRTSEGVAVIGSAGEVFKLLRAMDHMLTTKIAGSGLRAELVELKLSMIPDTGPQNNLGSEELSPPT